MNNNNKFGFFNKLHAPYLEISRRGTADSNSIYTICFNMLNFPKIQEFPMITTKRAYEKPTKSDGYRILVDRLWPRGLTKEEVAADIWMKDIAPSTELRKWFNHDPAKWSEFKKRYHHELTQHKDLITEIIHKAKHRTVTLIYGARDQEHNQAVVLKEYIEKHSSV